MKIAFVHNTFFPYEIGGAERSLKSRAMALKARGHDVKVFTLDATGKGQRQDIDGLEAEYLAFPWSSSSPYFRGRSTAKRITWHLGAEIAGRFSDQLVKCVRSFAPDIINTVNMPGLSFAQIARLQTLAPVVQTVVDYNALCIGGTLYKGDRECTQQCRSCRLVSAMRLPGFEQADRFVFISDFVRQRFAGVLGPTAQGILARSDVIHNGLETLPPHPEDSTPAPHAAAKPKVGFIGQISHIKGISWLIETFLAEGLNEHASLCVAGDLRTDLGQHLSRTYGSHADIELLGYCAPGGLFHQVDLVVVPSLWNEPLGRVPFEANAYGRPALVSRQGGLPELITPGVNGDMFDVERPGDFVRLCLHWLERIAKERAQIALECREHAATRHDPDVVAGRYEAVFDAALEAKR